MSKASPVSPWIRYSDVKIIPSNFSSGGSRLKLKNLIIQKIFKLSFKKAKNSLKPAKDPNDELMENLVSVEREYVKSLISSRFSRSRGGSGDFQKTPERKPCKKFKRKKLSGECPKHVKRASSTRKYDSTCSSPLSDKLSRILF